MKFCTNCNRVLQDDEVTCSHCAQRDVNTTGGADAALPSSARQEELAENRCVYHPAETPKTAAQNGKSEPPDIMHIAATVRSAKQTGDRSWDSSAARRAATNSFTIEIPIHQVFSGDSAPKQERQAPAKTADTEPAAQDMEEAESSSHEAEEFDFEGETSVSDDTGAIERVLEEDEVIGQAVTQKSGLGKLEITLIFILAAVLLLFGTLIAIDLFSAKQTEPEEYSFQQFVGTWISDSFYFDDSGSESEQILYREQLIIREDGTFSRRYLVVNPSIPEGYLTDEWEIEEEISGTVRFFEDSRTLALIWEEEKIIYDRYILSIDDTHMKLREYYSEEQADFFDMEFARV